jgi:hypothetical protein
MSSPETPPPVPPSLPQRHGCATAFMVLFGIALLLPGLCALLFGVGIMADQRPDPATISMVLIGLMVGFAGIMLIREAIRGPRR